MEKPQEAPQAVETAPAVPKPRGRAKKPVQAVTNGPQATLVECMAMHRKHEAALKQSK